MAGGNEAQGSDRMELPKDSDDEGERHVFRQVEAVTSLRFVPACYVIIGIINKMISFCRFFCFYRFLLF
jgi:hypothetical protein